MYLSVCFNNQNMTSADVGKHKALKIDPQEYIRCSELRKKGLPRIYRSADRQATSSDTVARASGAGSHPTRRSRHGHIAHLQANSRRTGNHESTDMQLALQRSGSTSYRRRRRRCYRARSVRRRCRCDREQRRRCNRARWCVGIASRPTRRAFARNTRRGCP